MSVASSPPAQAASAASGMRWELAPGWEHRLLANGRLPLETWIAKGQAHVVKRSPGRTIYRIDLPAQSLFLKHYRGDWRERLRQWFRSSAARREWVKALELQRRNVPTVRPVALGEPSRAQWVREQYFVSEAIDSAKPLGEWLAAAPAAGSDARRRRHVLDQLAELVAGAHRAGVVHDDLHVGNILVAESDHPGPRLYLIDVPKVRLTRPLNWRQSRDNLAMLYGGGLRLLTRGERARFWKRYRQQRPELPLADPAGAARELTDLAWKHAQRISERRDLRAHGTNRDFYQQRGRHGRGGAVRDVPADVLAATIAAPDERLHAALDQPLKLTQGSVVVRTTLPVGDGRAAIAYKRYRPKSFWKHLLGWVRPSRARESWERGHALLARGIATPRPLLACEPSRWRAPGVSYLATEWLDGAENLHLYAWRLRELSVAQRTDRTRRAARRIGELLGRLHAWQLTHHDLKGCNLLLADRDDDVQAWLIDLDAVRQRRNVSPRAARRNLSRFAASAQAHPWLNRTDYLRCLLAYLRETRRPAREWKSWWQAIAARSNRIADRLRQSDGPLA